MRTVDGYREYRRSAAASFSRLLRFGLRAAALAALLSLSPASAAPAADPSGLESRVRAIASELRCVVCQNLSVADSPSELAQQMRGIIREQLEQGKSPAQIKAYFVSRYGDWVLLAPPRAGFSLLVWTLPFLAATGGLVVVFLALRRWVRQKKPAAAAVDPELLARVRREAIEPLPRPVDTVAGDPRGELLRERTRLYEEIQEMDFDYQAGKLSEADYADLRRELETRAAGVLKDLETSVHQVAPPAYPEPDKSRAANNQAQGSYRRWPIAAGGAFLLLFGVTVGVYLSQSLRPRLSDRDLITGGFMTGTAPAHDVQALLARGRNAYESEEWQAAIESFKEALAIDPNQPEAHSYMGLILVRAGHPDGALLAFDRALGVDPNFPLALWGKGMLLYRVKEDFPAAEQTLRKLLALMPAGAEKAELEETVGELARLGGKQKTAGAPSASLPGPGIHGVISIDPRLRSKVDPESTLFVIGRGNVGAVGPPLAVKKIARPVFPLPYSLGPEDVMIPGMEFAGEVFISARLDRDGNAMTREAGDLAGEFKNNPAKVGSKNIDIVLDRAM